MAVHLTDAQINTILAKTGNNMKPGEINALVDALSRTKHVEDADSKFAAGLPDESTLSTVFAGTVNP